TAVPVIGAGGLIGYLSNNSEPVAAARGTSAFSQAVAGDCLTWPEDDSQAVSVVDCGAEHRFEVAEAVDLRTFPGSEYRPDAPAPSMERLEEIGKEQCERAVDRYLGPRFDPNGKFTIGMLWSGDRTWEHSGERRMLCGLQLPGPDHTQAPFAGRIAEQDQSKVFPPGVCLGIEPTTNQPTDVPVDCAAPHAMEVTGTVNLAERFPDVLPSEADQDIYIKEVCTRATEDYLAPVQLRNTTLTLLYSTMSLPSWTAGSRQLSCSVGMTLGDGGWATLLNSAKGELLINGQPPIPPPDIPEERLELLPLPTG
ncbi:MAG TPA: septum formation family protein, partial [Mycobacterium sp.]|nr:septum formation family protein [Mycobacterium sp.]